MILNKILHVDYIRGINSGSHEISTKPKNKQTEEEIGYRNKKEKTGKTRKN
jgi:hypothetical protein